MKETVLSWIRKYRHGWILSYFVIYLIWFALLEEHVHPEVWVRSPLDAYIPFCEYFVIPYMLWFLYIAAAIIYFLLTSPEDFRHMCGFLFTGMTICLILYTIFPNGHNLRPFAFHRDSIFIRIIQFVYAADPSTNVNPSIHCLNSIGVHTAIWRAKSLSDKPLIRIGSLILCISICLSTVFLKQHSIIDVLTAILLSLTLYVVFYRSDLLLALRRETA